MSNPTTETVKVLSTFFVEQAISGAASTTGVLAVASIWMYLGARFRFFNVLDSSIRIKE